MELEPKYEIVLNEAAEARKSAVLDPAASPFKLVVDPVMRQRLRQALFDLIDHHDGSLADYFTEGKLSLDSYKEYIELFARSLRETMESREGVAYLLKASGLDIPIDEINLQPEWRWR
jgi:hypothetical protein